MFTAAALRFANHVLAGEPWAQARLKPFAGQTACIEFGSFALSVAVSDSGFLVSSKDRTDATVTIRLPEGAPLKALTDRPLLRSGTQLAGSAEMAETLGFVFRNLRWDAEDDLSLLIGNIAARRMLQGGRKFAQWHVQQARNLALNAAEYLTEEVPAVARRTELARFSAAVDGIRNECNGLEQRLQALEAR